MTTETIIAFAVIFFSCTWTAFVAVGFYRLGRRHGRERANYRKLDY
jgi:hypothetical protein